MPSVAPDRFCTICGGEKRHARQRFETVDGCGEIVTWLLCVICGHKQLSLIYEEQTGKHYGVTMVR